MSTNNIFLQDFIIVIPFSLWSFFIVNWLSKWVYNFAIKRGFPPNSATYFGRKVIHIFAAGITTLFLPFLFKEAYIPFILGLGFAFYTYFFHKIKKLQNWYQVKENRHEVNFCIMWSLSILIGWFLDKSFWLGVIPALFMAFGDGVTGIIRNFRYKKQSKAWEGSLGMFLTCAVIGGLKMGIAGLVAAFVATFFERFDDDNIYIPVSSFLVLAICLYFFPELTKPFI